MDRWQKILQSGPDAVWVQGTGPRAAAIISRERPTSDKGAKPLDSLLRQLDLSEWKPVGGEP
jgi:hypothetical protein